MLLESEYLKSLIFMPLYDRILIDALPLIIPGPPPPGNGALIPLAPGGSPPRGAP